MTGRGLSSLVQLPSSRSVPPDEAEQVISSHTFGVDLAIVPIARVLPHEQPDPGRVSRLSQRIRGDGMLRDPIMAGRIEGVDGLVLLDGTNRRAALAGIGCDRVLAQIVDYADRTCIHLLTWSHLVELPVERVLAGARAVRGLDLVEIAQSDTDDELIHGHALAAVHAGRDSWLLRRGEGRRSRPDMLVEFVNTYEAAMQREARDEESVAQKLEEVRSRPGGHDAVLVTFPRLNRHQVVDLATRQTPIPAGITRHVIRCGRALRVNVPLEWLDPMMPLAESEAALRSHLGRLHPRRYLEPTVLFDS